MRKNGKSGGHAGPPLLALVLLVFLVPAPAVAQTEPHPLDTFLTDVLNFTKPTGIRGTVRYIDFDGPVLWLNWHQRSGDPSFEMGWHTVPGEAMLAVHPRDTDSIVDLRALRKGDCRGIDHSTRFRRQTPDSVVSNYVPAARRAFVAGEVRVGNLDQMDALTG